MKGNKLKHHSHNPIYNYFILICLITPLFMTSQIRFKTPKSNIRLINGYDTNVLRTASNSDSNRVASLQTSLAGDASAWIYWQKKLRSFVSAKGEYNLYPGNTSVNTWNIGGGVKTIYKVLKKRRKHWINGLDIYADLEFKSADKVYSDRTLAEDYYTTIYSKKINLRDLFDKNAFDLKTGFDFFLKNWVRFDLDYIYSINDYKNFQVGKADSLYSLDNKESELKTRFIFYPFSGFTAGIIYKFSHRKYEDKFDYSKITGIVNGQQREYDYQSFGLDVNFKNESMENGLDFDYKTRKDGFKGYLNYKAISFGLKSSYYFSSNDKIRLVYNYTQKAYDALTFAGTILENTYHTLKFEYFYRLFDNFSIVPAYVYEKEKSTYSKFSYNRHLALIIIDYQL